MHLVLPTAGTWRLSLRGWDGPEAVIDAPGATVRAIEGAGPDRGWLVQRSAKLGPSPPVRITVSMRLSEVSEIAVPVVAVDGATVQPRWLAIAGRELQRSDDHGLTRADVKELASWPAVADRIRRTEGEVWRIHSGNGSPKVRPHFPSAASPHLELLWAEQAAALLDGKVWTHRAEYLLFTEPGTAASVRLPEGAMVRSVEVNGIPVPPIQQVAGTVWVSLTGQRGLRQLHVTWQFPQAREPIDQPCLEPALLEGLPEVPILWTVHLPPGYEVSRREGGGGPTSASGLDLRRAGAILRLSALLAERVPGRESASTQALPQAQVTFHRLLASAERRIALDATTTDRGPSGQSLAEWLRDLREQNRRKSQELGYEKARTRAEKLSAQSPPPSVNESLAPTGDRRSQPGSGAFAQRGTPTHWEAAPGTTAPRLSLTVASSTGSQALWMGMLTLWLTTGGAWWLSRSEASQRIAARLWPEHLLALGLLAWVVFSHDRVGMALLGAGLVSRVFLLFRNRWARIQQAAAPVPTSQVDRGLPPAQSEA
jgi:hypothetical protein